MTGHIMSNTLQGWAPSRRAFLSTAAVTAAVGPVTAGSAMAASTRPAAGSSAEPGSPVLPQRPDQELRRLLREIDPRRIEASILALVGFGTRHTLSSQTDPSRGIGARGIGSSRSCRATPRCPAAG